MSILFSMFTLNFAFLGVRRPCAFISSAMVFSGLPDAYSLNAHCTNGAVFGSGMYFFVDLSTS